MDIKNMVPKAWFSSNGFTDFESERYMRCKFPLEILRSSPKFIRFLFPSTTMEFFSLQKLIGFLRVSPTKGPLTYKRSQ